MNKLHLYVERFGSKKILVLGDVMLDKYIHGNVTRISPEAPVQIVNVTRESFSPGGAANVAKNISALGATTYIAGVVGNDTDAVILEKTLKSRSILTSFVRDAHRPTIKKVRVMGHNQQLIRIDYEKTDLIDKTVENKIIKELFSLTRKVDGVIVSDYSKGVITRDVMKTLIALCRKNNKPIIVDPKPEHKEFYKGVYVITPNNKEASIMAGIEENDEKSIFAIGKKLVEDMDTNVIITRGEKGMAVFEKSSSVVMNIPTKAKEVYDVTGAGDTSIAALTLALCSGASMKESAVIANHAAGIVVGKIGTATLTLQELKKSLIKHQ